MPMIHASFALVTLVHVSKHGQEPLPFSYSLDQEAC